MIEAHVLPGKVDEEILFQSCSVAKPFNLEFCEKHVSA